MWARSLPSVSGVLRHLPFEGEGNHCDLKGGNRTAAKTADLVKKGAKAARSPKEVAAQSDIFVSMIADGPAVEAITFGESGVVKGVKSGSVFIDMSTVDPEASMPVAKAVEAKGG